MYNIFLDREVDGLQYSCNNDYYDKQIPVTAMKSDEELQIY